MIRYFDTATLVVIGCSCVSFCFYPFVSWKPDLSKCDIELQLADMAVTQLSLLLWVMAVIFCLRRKWPILKYVEMVLWVLFFIVAPYYVYQIPSVQQAYKITDSESNHE